MALNTVRSPSAEIDDERWWDLPVLCQIWSRGAPDSCLYLEGTKFCNIDLVRRTSRWAVGLKAFGHAHVGKGSFIAGDGETIDLKSEETGDCLLDIGVMVHFCGSWGVCIPHGCHASDVRKSLFSTPVSSELSVQASGHAMPTSPCQHDALTQDDRTRSPTSSMDVASIFLLLQADIICVTASEARAQADVETCTAISVMFALLVVSLASTWLLNDRSTVS